MDFLSIGDAEEIYADGLHDDTKRQDLTSELVQVDAPKVGTYGPVYNCDGELIDFCPDNTPCTDIKIQSFIFKCAGFSAIGHHGNDAHNKISNLENDLCYLKKQAFQELQLKTE